MHKIIQGDALTVLRTMHDNCVHCVVTSPPYFGLRDYGTAKWEGGDLACDHKQGRPGAGRADGIVDDRAQRNRDGVGSMGGDCKKCGAVRIDAQIGLEQSPQDYVQKLVEVFREVRRVLRSDGTLWLNLGDSYAGSGKGGNPENSPHKKQASNVGSLSVVGETARIAANTKFAGDDRNFGFKQKDLIGIPWRVAFALQADGWYLRQDIIRHKPNPMPESVRDRCTKAHEYLFLLTKSEKYYFDCDAIKETAVGGTPGNKTHKGKTAWEAGDKFQRTKVGLTQMSAVEFRNKRSVWTIAPRPYKEAHFATFPVELVEPCLKSGMSERGCCPQCATPWLRIADRKFIPQEDVAIDKGVRGAFEQKPMDQSNSWQGFPRGRTDRSTLGFYPQCACIGAPALPKYPDEPDAGHDDEMILWERQCDAIRVERQRLVEIASIYPVEPAVCMDIFGGAGTTGLVAKNLNRHCVLIELNPDYVTLIEKRLA